MATESVFHFESDRVELPSGPEYYHWEESCSLVLGYREPDKEQRIPGRGSFDRCPNCEEISPEPS